MKRVTDLEADLLHECMPCDGVEDEWIYDADAPHFTAEEASLVEPLIERGLLRRESVDDDHHWVVTTPLGVLAHRCWIAARRAGDGSAA